MSCWIRSFLLIQLYGLLAADCWCSSDKRPPRRSFFIRPPWDAWHARTLSPGVRSDPEAFSTACAAGSFRIRYIHRYLISIMFQPRRPTAGDRTTTVTAHTCVHAHAMLRRVYHASGSCNCAHTVIASVFACLAEDKSEQSTSNSMVLARALTESAGDSKAVQCSHLYNL